MLKTAEVVPIFKTAERELCSNYRLISILNPSAKLFEKCLLDQLNNYFVSNNLISPNQYGFRKNCSTNEAVLDIYNKILDNMDKKLIKCSIFLDLRKAYDTINHTILIKKLEKYGIRGLPLQLLASYLTDRQQYTIVNQYKSKSRDAICGIPQGLTLGPLLFNIHINDLPLASNSTIHLFADDTNLTLSHSNVSTLQQNINDELVNVSNWFKLNKLSINFNETEFTVVTTKQNEPELKISIDNNPIKLSHPEVESRTQGSRPRPRTQKKSEAKAKDSLSEDRRSGGQGQECSRPRPRTKDTKRKCSPKKKKRSSQKFFKRSPLKKRFQNNFSSAPQNFNIPKNSAVLEPRTGQFSRT